MSGKRSGNERGQASVELVAAVPALILSLLIAAQIAIAGYALWSAAVAARAGARAEATGASGAPAARRALPEGLRAGVQIAGNERIQVRVLVPRLIPGLPTFAVAASSRLDPQ